MPAHQSREMLTTFSQEQDLATIYTFLFYNPSIWNSAIERIWQRYNIHKSFKTATKQPAVAISSKTKINFV